jgi:hypothetical protein
MKISIINLIKDKNISSLCEQIDQFSLIKLKVNQSINHKEDLLAQTFLDTFIYTFASSNNIYPEHKIDLIKRESDERGYTIDLAIFKSEKKEFILNLKIFIWVCYIQI